MLSVINLYNLYHYFGILQQNYYYNLVSLKWYYDYRNPVYAKLKIIYIVAIIVEIVLLFFTVLFKLNLYILCLIVLLVVPIYCFINSKLLLIKLKKPLVFTKRIIRLILTTFLINFILFFCCLLLIKNVSAWFVFLILTLCLLNAVIVSIANIVNYPIEKIIQRHFIHKAKGKLKRYKNLKIIAITGSYGKTSTKNYLCKMLSTKYNVLCTPYSYNTAMGITRTILERLKPYHDILILEMGADHKNDINKLCKIVKPHISIITAVGEQHLQTFKSLENIINTKYQLVLNTLPDGLFVTNLTNNYCANFYNRSPIESLGVGLNKGDCKICNIKCEENLIKFEFEYYKDKFIFSTRLLGEFNVINILMSIIVADRLGIDINSLKGVVLDLKPVEHRLEQRVLGNGAIVIDDSFNSNPVGANYAIKALKSFNKKKYIITCGMVELGEKQYIENYNLGTQLNGVDEVLIVNNYNFEAISDGMMSVGCQKPKMYDSFNSAYKYISQKLDNNSVLLIENDLSDCYINF